MKACASLALGTLGMLPTLVFACGDSPVMTTTRDDGTQIRLVISEDDIVAAPAWNPINGEPPLGLSQAYQVAMNWAKANYTRYDDVKVREISLTKYSCYTTADRWYYTFDLIPTLDGNDLFGTGNWVAVLMNGRVVAPTRSR
jgi:hypothetical protein